LPWGFVAGAEIEVHTRGGRIDDVESALRGVLEPQPATRTPASTTGAMRVGGTDRRRAGFIVYGRSARTIGSVPSSESLVAPQQNRQLEQDIAGLRSESGRTIQLPRVPIIGAY